METEPLTPAVFYVLVALSDGDKHGYAISRYVEDHTTGRVRLGPGTLYGTIKRLLASAWVVETDERPADDDPRRRYYRLSEDGAASLRSEVVRLEGMLTLAHRMGRLGAV